MTIIGVAADRTDRALRRIRIRKALCEDPGEIARYAEGPVSSGSLACC
jgi:hypothetical protein